MVPKICSIDGCEKTARRRGWCEMHYGRWRRHGDPLAGNRRFSNPAESVKERTATAPNGCIIWTGATTTAGYGHLYADGRMIYAHRLVWKVSNGDIPAGMQIDHACRNRACCNLDHLRLVTNKENQENRSGEGRAGKFIGPRGVYWVKAKKKWVAWVNHHGGRYWLGYFEDMDEANSAVIAKRNELYTHNDSDRIVTLDQPRHWEDFDPTMLRDIGYDCGA